MEFSADIFGTWKEAKSVSSRREDTSEVSNEGMEESRTPVMSTSMSELSSLYSIISAKGLSFAGSIGSMECRKAVWVQG